MSNPESLHNPFEHLPQAPVPLELLNTQGFTSLQDQVDKLIPSDRRALPTDKDVLEAGQLLQQHEHTLMAAMDQEGYLVPALGLIRRLQSIGYHQRASTHTVGQAHNIAAGLVGRHIQRISSALERKPDVEGLHSAMDAVVESLKDAPDLATPAQVDFLIDHIEDAARYSLFTERRQHSKVSRLQVESEILRYAPSEQQRRYAAAISRMMAADEAEVATAGIDFLAGLSSAPLFSAEVKDEVQETAVRGLVEGYGLDFDVVKQKWGIGSGMFSAMYEGANLKALHSLERGHPGTGICKTLYNEFGIVNFARYPESMLIAQYKQRENSSIPYGILLTAASDSGGVMWRNNRPFGDFQEQLAHLDAAVRIYEVGHKLGIPRALVKSGKRYGPMQFRVVVGHGCPDHIGFGESPEPFDKDTVLTPDTETDGAILTKYDIQKMDMPGLAEKYAAPGCETIIVSCSTGEEGGIAQEVSKAYSDSPVTAPTIPVSLEKLIVTRNSAGRLHIDVRYGFSSNNGAKLRYLGGRVIASEMA